MAKNNLPDNGNAVMPQSRFLRRPADHRERRTEREDGGKFLDRLPDFGQCVRGKEEIDELRHRHRHRNGLHLAHRCRHRANAKEQRAEHQIGQNKIGEAQVR